MSLDQLKRLNVIGDFQSKVDRELINEDYPLLAWAGSRSSSGKYCVAIPRPAILNQKEQDYLKQIYNLRKSFDAGFFTLQQLKEGKRLGAFADFAASLVRNIELCESTDVEAVYFLVSRARW